MNAPPSVLDDARVLEYAIIDNTVQYTGRLNLHVNDKRLGAVPCLAICENLGDGELLLFHCDERWNVLGIQAWNSPGTPSVTSVNDIKRRAEEFYTGISAKWVAVEASV